MSPDEPRAGTAPDTAPAALPDALPGTVTAALPDTVPAALTNAAPAALPGTVTAVEEVVVARSLAVSQRPDDGDARIALADALLRLGELHTRAGHEFYAVAAVERAVELLADRPARHAAALDALAACYDGASLYERRAALVAAMDAHHALAVTATVARPATDPALVAGAVAAGTRLMDELAREMTESSSAGPLERHAAFLRGAGPEHAGERARALVMLMASHCMGGRPTAATMAAARDAMALWRAGSADPAPLVAVLEDLVRDLRDRPADAAVVLADVAELHEATGGDAGWAQRRLAELYGGLGRADEALAAAKRSVDVSDGVDRCHAAVYLVDRLQAARRHDEATRVVEDGLADARALGPGGHRWVGVLLDRLQTVHLATGRHDDAHAAAAEAVELFRTLAADNADELPGLAIVLTNLGKSLGTLGRTEEALAASVEAVDAHRRIDEPEDDEPFVVALNNLAIDLHRSGRDAEAAPAAAEGVALARRLLAEDDDRMAAHLAGMLNILGLALAGVGRHADALVATTEAVEICRRLTAEDPDDGAAHLADALIDHATVLTAGAAADRPADHRRGHAADRPTDDGPADHRRGHAVEAAAEAAAEGVSLYRRLAADDPVTFEPDLARALRTLAEAGPHPEAAAEAAELYERLAADRPAVFAGPSRAARASVR